MKSKKIDFMIYLHILVNNLGQVYIPAVTYEKKFKFKFFILNGAPHQQHISKLLLHFLFNYGIITITHKGGD